MDSSDLEALKAGESSGSQARKQARLPETSINVTSLEEKTYWLCQVNAVRTRD